MFLIPKSWWRFIDVWPVWGDMVPVTWSTSASQLLTCVFRSQLSLFLFLDSRLILPLDWVNPQGDYTVQEWEASGVQSLDFPLARAPAIHSKNKRWHHPSSSQPLSPCIHQRKGKENRKTLAGMLPLNFWGWMVSVRSAGARYKSEGAFKHFSRNMLRACMASATAVPLSLSFLTV